MHDGNRGVKKNILDSNSADSHAKRRAIMARQELLQELNARAAIVHAQSKDNIGSSVAPSQLDGAQARSIDSDSGAPLAEQFGSSDASTRAVAAQAHSPDSDSETPAGDSSLARQVRRPRLPCRDDGKV